MVHETIKYNFEYERRLRVGFIGCGGHSFRNIYPTFQYAPVDLVSVCDLSPERAAHYARRFGAERAYTSHRDMLEREELDAVFIVTAYDEQGHPQAFQLALDALEAGCHVWMEKPPAAGAQQIRELIQASRRAGKQVMVGFKKMFFPAIEKAKGIIGGDDFGTPRSIYLRYPQGLPPEEQRQDDRCMAGFLDHIVHPASIMIYLMGPVHSLYFLREEWSGGTVASIRFRSGAIGTLHLTAGQSGASPLERVEVIGDGANVVVDNGVHVTYYRKAFRGHYGRTPSYLVSDEQAPLFWEPEFSLGQLYNKNLFMLGYAQEVLHFCECVLGGTPLEKAHLYDALQIMKVYEAYRAAEGKKVILPED